MPGITYDAGALVAAERGDRLLWSLHRRALERGLRPTVPAGVLGQAWRGGPQAELSRLLKGCRIEGLDETRARTAGDACGRAGTADVIDASVAVGAIAMSLPFGPRVGPGQQTVLSDECELVSEPPTPA